MNETEFLSGIGKRIKEIRIEKKMSQTQLAASCDFDKASMSRIESGQTNPTSLTLYKISRALGVPIEEFFRTGHPESSPDTLLN